MHLVSQENENIKICKIYQCIFLLSKNNEQEMDEFQSKEIKKKHVSKRKESNTCEECSRKMMSEAEL